jgi:hypothetical protein
VPAGAEKGFIKTLSHRFNALDERLYAHFGIVQERTIKTGFKT